MKARYLPERIFENPFVDYFKGDLENENYVREVSDAFYSRVAPSPVSQPTLLAWSADVAKSLGLSPEMNQDSATVGILSGNSTTTSMKPYAARYGGHQFGQWAGQLGDGRAISLGSLKGEDNISYELQLKGAGPTPYSRRADGRAVLRSSLREFLCSEAMHHLGAPTTRALSLISTGDRVLRDIFYDGNPRQEPGAIVCRVAPSFIRFGHFEIFADYRESENLKQLLDYTIRTHFPGLLSSGNAISEDTYLEFFSEVSRRTARMIAHWMSVGFVHGVMNTDNLSILGLTIDYGPYGWLEPFEPGWTPNTTDNSHKRYAYGRQPNIALWNLSKLAQSLTLVVNDIPGLEFGLKVFEKTFEEHYFFLMNRKLGFLENAPSRQVILEVLEILEELRIDMTIFFRHLSSIVVTEDHGRIAEMISASQINTLLATSYEPQPHESAKQKMIDILGRYLKLLQAENYQATDVFNRMNEANPKYVLRNYLAHQAAVKCEAGDNSLLNDLFKVLQSPFEEHPALAHLAVKRPDWAASTPGCSALSCSS